MGSGKKIAALFPGQGSQAVGMGADFAKSFDVSRQVFDEASEALGYDALGKVTEGTAEELKRTEFTQPLVLTASLAAYRAAVEEVGPTFEGGAGHSLGEYSALVAAGAVKVGDAVRIVRSRGRLMQEAVPEGEGAMAALIGGSPESISEMCDSIEGIVQPANFNCPGQVVISGAAGPVAEALGVIKNFGIAKAIPLPVSAPFHCPLMKPAAEGLKPELDGAEWGGFNWPVITNADAEFNTDGGRVADIMFRQIESPVRWEESIKKMLEAGFTHFVEMGPGNVLTGFMRRIDRKTPAISVSKVEDLEKLKEFLGDD
jgi:[acyl-carrier-protein] S-malonyltransferase